MMGFAGGDPQDQRLAVAMRFDATPEYLQTVNCRRENETTSDELSSVSGRVVPNGPPGNTNHLLK